MDKKVIDDVRSFGEGLKAIGEVVSETANYFEAISEIAYEFELTSNLEEIQHKQDCIKALNLKKYTLGLTYFENQRLNQLQNG